MNVDKIQVYYGDLNSIGSKVYNYQYYLSPEENARALKFRFDKDRDVYRQSHALLNCELIKRLKISINSLDIRFFDNKKPYIKDFDLDFNLSHSGEYFAYIIANDDITKVGIDVEVINFTEIHSVVNQFFHKNEIDYVNSDKHKILIRFYEIWTRKEAYLKMLGFGLTENLSDINVDPRKRSFKNYCNNGDKRRIYIYTYIKNDFVLSVAVSKPAELVYCKL